MNYMYVQGSAKSCSPGCVNAAGKARQKQYAKVTKPGACLLAELCTALLADPLPSLCRHHMYMTPNGSLLPSTEEGSYSISKEEWNRRGGGRGVYIQEQFPPLSPLSSFPVGQWSRDQMVGWLGTMPWNF